MATLLPYMSIVINGILVEIKTSSFLKLNICRTIYSYQRSKIVLECLFAYVSKQLLKCRKYLAMLGMNSKLFTCYFEGYSRPLINRFMITECDMGHYSMII